MGSQDRQRRSRLLGRIVHGTNEDIGMTLAKRALSMSKENAEVRYRADKNRIESRIRASGRNWPTRDRDKLLMMMDIHRATRTEAHCRHGGRANIVDDLKKNRAP